MQIESFFPARSRFLGLILFSGALLAPVAGCHRSPAPDVIATVNGKEILRPDLEKYYKASLGDNPQLPSTEQAEIVRLNILRQLIDDEILQQRAAKLLEIKALSTQEEFDKQLKQRNETLEDFKRDLRRQLTTTKLLNKEIESKINITDGEISGYYEAHKAEFNLIEPRYNIARIAVTSTPSPKTANLQNNKASGDADAKKKIQTLHQKLDSGEEFGAVAMNYSEDKDTSANGGDMGFIPESQLHAEPEVYNAIGKLKPGQFTDVLPIVDPQSHRTIGYAIYKLISREAAGQRTLTDVRVQQLIRQGLRDGHAQLLKSAYFEKLRDEAKVQNYLANQILKEGAK